MFSRGPHCSACIVLLPRIAVRERGGVIDDARAGRSGDAPVQQEPEASAVLGSRAVVSTYLSYSRRRPDGSSRCRGGSCSAQTLSASHHVSISFNMYRRCLDNKAGAKLCNPVENPSLLSPFLTFWPIPHSLCPCLLSAPPSFPYCVHSLPPLLSFLPSCVAALIQYLVPFLPFLIPSQICFTSLLRPSCFFLLLFISCDLFFFFVLLFVFL